MESFLRFAHIHGVSLLKMDRQKDLHIYSGMKQTRMKRMGNEANADETNAE